MRSRWILNLILAAIVVALALFAYLRPQSGKSSGTPLTALSADMITHIRIEPAGKGLIELEKDVAGWRMNVPVRARANPFNVDNLIQAAATTSHERVGPPVQELATYGLDKPLVRLRFNDHDVAIGTTHPLKREHYVQYRDAVHLVPSQVLVTAFLGYGSFLATQLIEDGHELAALRLPGLQLTRKEGTWVREPAGKQDEQISGDRVNEFVARWQNAHALSVEKLSSRPALDRIQLIFETGGKRETLTLDILAYKPEFILARRDEGLEYHFPEEVGKQLLNLMPSD